MRPKTAKNEIATLKTSSKHEIKKLMKKHEIDIESLREKHKLDIEIKEKELLNSATYSKMGNTIKELFSGILNSLDIKNVLNEKTKESLSRAPRTLLSYY